MFWEWVTNGAGIGVTAFFAIAVFAICCVFLLGLMGLIVEVVKKDDSEDETYGPHRF